MTQQPFYPQYPTYPQQPQGQPQQQQQQYQQPAPQYQQPAPQYQQPAPPQQPQQPLAKGTLDDYYSQPSTGGGPALSWKGKPDGTSYTGIVARNVTNADVQQDTDPITRQPKFYRDGRPKFSMIVPLKVQPSQEFPEGEARLYVRGQLRDELVRAMREAGATDSPKGGDALAVTLVQRKPTQSGIAANVFAVQYRSAGGGQAQAQQDGQAGTGAPSPAPVPEQAPPQPQYQQQAAPQAQQPNGQSPWAATPQTVPGQQLPQAPQQQAQAPQPQAQQPQQAQGPLQLPQLTPEQQELMARLTGQQP